MQRPRDPGVPGASKRRGRGSARSGYPSTGPLPAGGWGIRSSPVSPWWKGLGVGSSRTTAPSSGFKPRQAFRPADTQHERGGGHRVRFGGGRRDRRWRWRCPSPASRCAGRASAPVFPLYTRRTGTWPLMCRARDRAGGPCRASDPARVGCFSRIGQPRGVARRRAEGIDAAAAAVQKRGTHAPLVEAAIARRGRARSPCRPRQDSSSSPGRGTSPCAIPIENRRGGIRSAPSPRLRSPAWARGRRGERSPTP